MVWSLSRALLPPNQNLCWRPSENKTFGSLEVISRSCDNDRIKLRAKGVAQFYYISWKGWRTRMKPGFARATRLVRTTAPGNQWAEASIGQLAPLA